MAIILTAGGSLCFSYLESAIFVPHWFVILLFFFINSPSERTMSLTSPHSIVTTYPQIGVSGSLLIGSQVFVMLLWWHLTFSRSFPKCQLIIFPMSIVSALSPPCCCRSCQNKISQHASHAYINSVIFLVIIYYHLNNILLLSLQAAIIVSLIARNRPWRTCRLDSTAASNGFQQICRLH